MIARAYCDEAERQYERLLRQARGKPPAWKRARPLPPQQRARFGFIGSSSNADNIIPNIAAQKAIATAARRIKRLQHQARIGHRKAAARLRGLADAITAEVLA